MGTLKRSLHNMPRNMDPRCDPESARRLASGFWSYSYDPYNDVETWSCDKYKLNDALVRKMLDPEFRYNMNNNPRRTIDSLWGEHTYDALRHNTPEGRVNMRLKPMSMANPHYWSTGTSTTATTCTNSGTWYSSETHVKAKQAPSITSTKAAKRIRRRLTPRLYVGSPGLADALQKAFDGSYGSQMRLLHG